MSVKKIFTLTCLLTPLLAQAVLNENMLLRLNSDYKRIEKLRAITNPKLKDLETLVNEKNQAFLKRIQNRVAKNELELITKDLNSVKVANAKNMNKEYLSSLESSKDLKLSNENQQLLNTVISSSNSHLRKGVSFAAVSKLNTDRPAKLEVDNEVFNKPVETFGDEKVSSSPANTILSEADKIKHTQKAALLSSKQDKGIFQESDDDSIFKKVSKAYHRNLEKVIEEEKKD